MKTRILFATVCLWFCVLDAPAASPNQTSGMRSTNGFGWGITTIQSLVGKAATGNLTNESGSRVAYLIDVISSTNGSITMTVVTNVSAYQAFLATNNYAATVTNIFNYLESSDDNQFNTNTIGQPIHGLVTFGDGVAGDGGGVTNIQCTNIVLAVKSPFSTNYTVRLVDQVLACTGTNQILTLPEGNGAMTGRIFCFLMSSTTGYGSAIVTNGNGAQTVLTAADLSQTITNGQSLTVIWDGANWR